MVVLDGKKTFQFYAPSREYIYGHKKPLEYLSVSGDIRGQVHDSGLVGVWSNELSSNEKRSVSPPFANFSHIHAGDVYFLNFFPSGKVALTGGADSTLRIWDLVDFDEDIKESDAMLGGTHTLGVLSADFVDRGKNIVSSSRDGSIAIWDVPTQKCTRVLDRCMSEINCVNVLKHKNIDNTHLVIASSEKGEMYIYDIRTKIKIFKMKTQDAIHSTQANNELIVCGTASGSIHSWDLRALSISTGPQEKNVYRRKNTIIHRIRHFEGNNYLVGSSEGAYLLDINNMESLAEYSGSRENKTKGVDFNYHSIFAGGSDGIVRTYRRP